MYILPAFITSFFLFTITPTIHSIVTTIKNNDIENTKISMILFLFNL